MQRRLPRTPLLVEFSIFGRTDATGPGGVPQLLADAPLVILVLSPDLRIIHANDVYLVCVLRPRWLSGFRQALSSG